MNEPASPWNTVRHVVRVYGHARDEQGRPLGACTVTLWSAPEPAKPAGSPACSLCGQVQARPDGLFFFVDCSAGKFVVRATDPAGLACGVTRVEVGDDPVRVAVADITCRRRRQGRDAAVRQG